MCSRIGTIVKVQNGKATALKLSCRSWNCDDCREGRKRSLIGEIRDGQPQRLITLTVNPHWFDSPEERARRLVAAWRLIRRRFLKLHPNAICEFMAVFEKTKLGEPHIHIAQRGAFMAQRWLSRQLEELMGAKIVDIRYIKNAKHVAYYVSKYIGKEPNQFGSLKRYWRSKKYLPMSKRAARLLRNAGAKFYILENHWRPYYRHCLALFGLDRVKLLSRGFEFPCDDADPPPWCLCLDPICC